MTINNTGHGHVTPRSDGIKARCGGPALCAGCQREAAAQLPREDEKGCEACVTCGVPTDWAQQLAYHEAQDGLLSQAQDEVARLRAELAEVQRQLDAQMARLNENLTTANARIAELEGDLATAQDLARWGH